LAHPSVPKCIELKWSPENNCTITHLTAFSICEEVKGSDCVVSKDELKKRASKSRSWGTFWKNAEEDSYDAQLKDARKGLLQGDVADYRNEVDTRQRMELENNLRQFEKQRKKKAERSQVPSAIPHSDEISASPAPQSPIPQAWTESPASTFYSANSPVSGFGSASTAVSSPEVGSYQMQHKGDGKNSWGKKLTSVFKKKGKDDIQRPQLQTPVATLPKVAEENVDHRHRAQHQAGQA